MTLGLGDTTGRDRAVVNIATYIFFGIIDLNLQATKT